MDDDCEDEEPLDSKQLLISGLPDDTDEESIEIFFESKRKSGGGLIRRTDFRKEQGEAVIEFKSWKGN